MAKFTPLPGSKFNLNDKLDDRDRLNIAMYKSLLTDNLIGEVIVEKNVRYMIIYPAKLIDLIKIKNIFERTAVIVGTEKPQKELSQTEEKLLNTKKSFVKI